MNIFLYKFKSLIFFILLFFSFCFFDAQACEIEEEHVQKSQKEAHASKIKVEESEKPQEIVWNKDKITLKGKYSQTPTTVLYKGYYLVTINYVTTSDETLWRISGNSGTEQEICYHRNNNLKASSTVVSTYIKIPFESQKNVSVWIKNANSLDRVSIKKVDREIVPKRFRGRKMLPKVGAEYDGYIMGAELHKYLKNRQIKFGNKKGTFYDNDINKYSKKKKK